MAAGFVSEPFQKTRIVEMLFTEHSTAQSVWPGLANSPLITLCGFFVYGVCGIVQPRRWSSRTTLPGSSGKAVGGSRTIRRSAPSNRLFRSSGGCVNAALKGIVNSSRAISGVSIESTLAGTRCSVRGLLNVSVCEITPLVDPAGDTFNNIFSPRGLDQKERYIELEKDNGNVIRIPIRRILAVDPPL